MPDGLHTSLRRIAPPRFLVFGVVLVAVSTALVVILADRRLALLIGFDVAALVFLTSVLPLLHEDTREMRQRAATNDANRVAMLAITVLLSIVILFAIGTLALTWVFANTVFALHYSHLYYLRGKQGDLGGLKIPGDDTPGYWDFLYFSFTLGMTFQTSDVVITGPHIRKVVLGHTSAAFLFNMGVLAFAVNALGAL